ncbi:MAG: glycoside hydrolase family 92 protein [Gordonia sp. (in: high G+C Gram-positive bacteria)]|nr:MAG: glycoside hydrolase family 92 protein [Gordonia sp. (in: high G+C Gram-positive bacteria)]
MFAPPEHSDVLAPLTRGLGPSYAVNAKPGVGLTSAHPWGYCVAGPVGRRWRAQLADTGLEGATIPVGTALRFAVFPCFDDSEPDVRDGYAATAVAVDIVFTDGSRLSDAAAVDQYGVALDPQTQYGARLLSVDQWSSRTVTLDLVVGRTVERVELVGEVPVRTDDRVSERAQSGFVDRIDLVKAPAAPTEPVGCVRTTRGTFSSDRFSRGGCAPLVAVPHGFVFGLPMTDGGNRGWPYSYHEASRVDTNPPQDPSTDTASVRPYLQAFATSHIPSPWMGDRGSFQVFPHPLAHPNPDRHERALPFSHDEEIDRPHLYSVVLDDGVHPPVAAELTAGSHSVWLRATYGGDTGSLVFDQIDGDGFLDLPEPVPGRRYTATGYVDGPGGLTHVPRTYVHVEVDGRVLSARRFPGHERESVIGTLTVGLNASDRSVTVGIGVSHISLEQAKRNLGVSIHSAPGLGTPRSSVAEHSTTASRSTRPPSGFDAVVADTRAQWNEILGRLTVENATPDQRVTLYSSLYRVHLYPNIASEPTPGGWRFASPFAYRTDVDDSPTMTGRRIVDGLLTVTDGFWDSYRASWPLRTLIAPVLTGRLLEGFVEHYRDGGWVSRWSAPAPADIMTGTSSDAVFADAAIAGIGELGDYSVLDAYDSCLRNATVPSDNRFVGRKGMDRSMFTGYADTHAHEGLSWTIDAAINDASIAAFSAFLRHRHPDHERAAEFAANATWFAARAARYALMFDAQTDFFRGREPVSEGVALGPWRAGEFDPRDWGTDYTETNAWGTRFTAPQDGEGLAQLYGGREALERRLDEFMALPETGREEFKGGYPVVIHEMREARDTRMGMLALSNQPAHHIPFMYAFASREGSRAHAKTQAIVRDAVERLFSGSDLGQGYPGDEDNGEMSAWYLLAVSGLYPLTIGSGQFVLCAPMYRRLIWTMENGAAIEIVAPSASAVNRYIQSVRVDGQAWDRITIERERLVEGAVIEFDLGPQPSVWAAETVPPALTPPGSAPMPPVDLTSPGGRGAIGGVDAGNAFDDSSGTAPAVVESGGALGWEFEAPTALDHYTLTVDEPGEYSWEFSSRGPDGEWQSVARQQAEFRWGRQTRIFAVESVSAASAYRLVFAGAVRVAQLEFLLLAR